MNAVAGASQSATSRIDDYFQFRRPLLPLEKMHVTAEQAAAYRAAAPYYSNGRPAEEIGRPHTTLFQYRPGDELPWTAKLDPTRWWRWLSRGSR